MPRRSLLLISSLFLLFIFSSSAIAAIRQVRVVNETKSNIYIHVGGHSSSKKIPPGKWEIFPFPFKTKKPNSQGEEVTSSLLVATSGGQWITTPNGFTYLDKPDLVQCLDYGTAEHLKKTGNRVWVIKDMVVDKYCLAEKLRGYKQMWFIEP